MWYSADTLKRCATTTALADTKRHDWRQTFTTYTAVTVSVAVQNRDPIQCEQEVNECKIRMGIEKDMHGKLIEVTKGVDYRSC